jgi:hypothetical protein
MTDQAWGAAKAAFDWFLGICELMVRGLHRRSRKQKRLAENFGFCWFDRYTF